MVKLCPFMSRVMKAENESQTTGLFEVECQGVNCMAYFPGWPDKKNSDYCQLIVRPSQRE